MTVTLTEPLTVPRPVSTGDEDLTHIVCMSCYTAYRDGNPPLPFRALCGHDCSDLPEGPTRPRHWCTACDRAQAAGTPCPNCGGAPL